MITVWALLLLIAAEYYFARLPLVDKITAFKNSKFNHAAVSRMYFEFVGSCFAKLPKLPAWAQVLLLLLPLASLIYLLDRTLLVCTGHGGGTIFAAVVIIYCAGNINSSNVNSSICSTDSINDDIDSTSKASISESCIVDSESDGVHVAVKQRVDAKVYTVMEQADADDVEDDINNSTLLITAHEKMFGIIFWFVLLGTAGAVVYWLLINRKYIASNNVTTNSEGYIAALHALAAWVPARITCLIYALVGNFSTGFNCWLKCMQIVTMPSSKCLLDCGQAALLTTADDRDDIEHLVNRAFIVWIVFGILFALLWS